MSRDVDQTESRLSRRRLLALSGAGIAGSLAGCGGGGDGEATTTTATTATPTDTPTPTPTDTTETTTTEPTSETETTTTESAPALSEYLARSPGSHVAPADGFTDLSWVDEADLEVLKVTTLDSEGEGSLRWAVGQEGPRLVVFEVGGVIDLGTDSLEVSNDKCWIAGHTAPPPGITLIRGNVGLDANDCIVQHLRSRPGDADQDVGWQLDAITTVDGTENNVVDHCTATWCTDEALSVGYHTRRTTVTNCMIAEALWHSTHPKGAHSYGSLTGNGAEQVTYAGNLWAHNTGRNPRLKAEVEAVVANNVMYHFEEAANLDGTTVAAIHRNAFLRSGGSNIDGQGVDGSRASVGGNYTDSDVRMTTKINHIGMKPFWPPSLETMAAREATDAVLGTVGARPAQRDAHEERIVRHVRERAGDYIDSQEEVGGYPDFEPTERTLDVPEPGEGLGEWLYQHRKAVELPDASPP